MWEYIAGLFDGEGHLGRKWGNQAHLWRIEIVNTNLKSLETIRDFMGFGRLYKRGKPKKSTHNQAYCLIISKQVDIYLFLSNIAKYLIIKREKAEEALNDLSSWRDLRKEKWSI